MKAARWLAFGAGAGLGALAACFTPPELTGPYQCSPQRTCPGDPDLSCVAGLCCKEDGGEPACPPPIVPDGGPTDGGQDGGPDGGSPDAGPDGGSDGGADAGQDAGCTVPMPPSCNVGGADGSCAMGQWTCDGGGLQCQQFVDPVPESCNGLDDNCNGIADDYPCRGGPPNLLAPGPEDRSGAIFVDKNVGALPQGCLVGITPPVVLWVDAGYLDGGSWRAIGPVTHAIWGQKADGGTWDLSRSGQLLRVALTGTMARAALPPIFAGHPQPQVLLCGPFGTWQRYIPRTAAAVLVENGNNFTVSTSVDLSGAGGNWRLDPTNGTSGGFNLQSVSRVEFLLTPRDPLDGGNPTFDAGVSTFGFFPP